MIWIEEKENLERLIIAEKKSSEEIGRFYGVCGATIKKQAKKLGIQISPRRSINPKETFNKGIAIKNGKYLPSNKNIDKKVDNSIFFEKRIINGNHKSVGEIGERIAIGELAKFGIDVMLPMSDNLPFDLIVYRNNKFFKCQVKTTNSINENGSLTFSLSSNNWYSKTTHKYNEDEVNVFILCDLNNIYLVTFGEVKGKSSFIIRNSVAKSKQYKGINFALDYIISYKRINEVFI